MNAYSIHMMNYMLAKIIFSVKRKLENAPETLHDQSSWRETQEVWTKLLDRLGMHPESDAWRVSSAMLDAAFRRGERLTSEDERKLRSWFEIEGLNNSNYAIFSAGSK